MAFIYASYSDSETYTCILIININEMTTYPYYINFEKYAIGKIFGFSYKVNYIDNDYLVLATTVTQINDSPICLSMLIIFGYIYGIEEN